MSTPVKNKNTTSCLLRVRFAETDLMGIVHHASYLMYFEVARVEYMRRRDVSYADWVGRGVHMPVVDVGIRYRRPARFDQVLLVQTWIEKLSRYSARFAYSIHGTNPSNPTEQGASPNGHQLLVEGHTLLACVDNDGQLRTIPDEIAGRVAGPELGGLNSDVSWR